MQRYIPGFELKEGTTFQIGIGQNHRGHTLTVDFLVSGVLFEYHAVRFWRNSKNWGDFKDYKEYRDYRRELNALPKHERARFTEQTKQLLAQNYYDKKRAFLDTNPDHREKELVVAISPGEFYEKIIRRFGVNVPDKGTFNTEFQKLLSEVVADYEKGQNPANGKKRRKH